MKVIHLSTSNTASEVTIGDNEKLASIQRLVGDSYVDKLVLTHNLDLIVDELTVSNTPRNPIAERLINHFEAAPRPEPLIHGDAVLAGVDGPDWVSAPHSAWDTLAFLGYEVIKEES